MKLSNGWIGGDFRQVDGHYGDCRSLADFQTGFLVGADSIAVVAMPPPWRLEKSPSHINAAGAAVLARSSLRADTSPSDACSG